MVCVSCYSYILKFKNIWTYIGFIAIIVRPVDVQFAVPMVPAPPPPMFPIMPVPAAVPIIAHALIPMAIPEQMLSSNTAAIRTTTTTKKPETIAVAIPVPMPVPMAVPMGFPVFPPPNSYQGTASRPKNCPPCPPCVCGPSCTPSFFSYCSPCHLKCRCKNREDVPQPLPNNQAQAPLYGMPVPAIIGPPPVVVVPYPPQIHVKEEKKRRPVYTKYSSCSEDSTELSSSSSESDYIRRRRYKKRKRLSSLRKNLRSSDRENELVKPMLSYINDNGDIKFKTKINRDDVAELLGEKEVEVDKFRKVHVMHEEGVNDRPNVIVISNNGVRKKPERYRKVLLREGVSSHVLEGGKKELIIKPSGDKKISNLSVSFHIS